jgi:hypothetical protein
MAAAALCGEVCLAGARITDEDAGSRFTDRRGFALGSDSLDNAPNICCYGSPVLRAYGNGRHARVLTAALDDGENQFAILIAERNL